LAGPCNFLAHAYAYACVPVRSGRHCITVTTLSFYVTSRASGMLSGAVYTRAQQKWQLLHVRAHRYKCTHVYEQRYTSHTSDVGKKSENIISHGWKSRFIAFYLWRSCWKLKKKSACVVILIDLHWMTRGWRLTIDGKHLSPCDSCCYDSDINFANSIFYIANFIY